MDRLNQLKYARENLALAVENESRQQQVTANKLERIAASQSYGQLLNPAPVGAVSGQASDGQPNLYKKETNAEFQNNLSENKNIAMKNLGSLGIDHSDILETIEYLGNNIVGFNLNWPGIKKRILETINPRLLTFVSLKAILQKYSSDLQPITQQGNALLGMYNIPDAVLDDASNSRFRQVGSKRQRYEPIDIMTDDGLYSLGHHEVKRLNKHLNKKYQHTLTPSPQKMRPAPASIPESIPESIPAPAPAPARPLSGLMGELQSSGAFKRRAEAAKLGGFGIRTGHRSFKKF